VFGAAEGLVIELQADPDARPMAEAATAVGPRRLPNPLDRVVLLAVNPAPGEVLAAAVRADGGQLIDVVDAATLLQMVAERQP